MTKTLCVCISSAISSAPCAPAPLPSRTQLRHSLKRTTPVTPAALGQGSPSQGSRMAGLTADDAESEEVGEGGAAIGDGGIRGAAICSACTGPGAASGSATFITAPRRLREEHATPSARQPKAKRDQMANGKRARVRSGTAKLVPAVPRDRANAKRGRSVNVRLCRQ